MKGTMIVLSCVILFGGVIAFMCGGHFIVEDALASAWYGVTDTIPDPDRVLTAEDGVHLFIGTIGAMLVTSIGVVRVLLKLTTNCY